LEADRTLDCFYLNCAIPRVDEERIFDLLWQLMNGAAIEPNESESVGLLAVSSLLGSTELLHELLAGEAAIDLSTVCSRLRRKSVLGVSVDEEIDFAASRFSEIDFEDLKGLDVSVLERILKSESLHLKDEDSLLDFIFSLESEDGILLLRCLRSEYLSPEGMERLLARCGDPNVDRLIFDSVQERLRLPVSPKGLESRFVGVEIPWKGPGSLDGIISHLTAKHGGNVHEKGVVEITSKSVDPHSPERVPQVTADFTSTDSFCSKNTPEQWICWEFRGIRVRPTHYTMEASYLKSWVLECSLDGTNWKTMDCRNDTLDFNRSLPSPASSFAVSSPAECRFIRLVQTDLRHGGEGHWLILEKVEFFGTLSP
jgi:hypothetical protein